MVVTMVATGIHSISNIKRDCILHVHEIRSNMQCVQKFSYRKKGLYVLDTGGFIVDVQLPRFITTGYGPISCGSFHPIAGRNSDIWQRIVTCKTMSQTLEIPTMSPNIIRFLLACDPFCGDGEATVIEW